MNVQTRFAAWVLGLVGFCLWAAGCQTLREAGVPGMERYLDTTSQERDEEMYRNRFQETRDPEAMRWLLANRIQAGMSVADVSHVFGEEGVREYNDRWLKTGGGHFRTGDRVYKWGPDNRANSVFLVFRDDRLVNFDPREYRDPFPSFGEME